MRIDKDSHGTILSVWAICLVLFLLLCLLTDKVWILCPAGFRLPDRTGPGREKTVTSVADGEVVIVDHLFEKEYLKRECIRISIYMDFMNVHANFWPVTGEVTYCQYHPGKHKLAFLPKSSDLNEHATTAIRTFARRVVSYSKPGLQVRAGEQCGIIKLGSRIDFFLPIDADIKVDEGDIVRACETVIAEL